MNWITRNSTGIVIAGIIMSFLCGATIAIRAGALLRYPDEQDWTRLAANLIDEHVYTLDGMHATAFRPPGFAFLLSLPIASGVGNIGFRFVNLGMFLLSEVLLVLLAQQLFSKGAAAISVLLVLAYPVLVYSATLLLPQTFGATLLLLGIWLLIRHESPRARDVALGGVVWGFLILTIPTFIFVMGWFVVWLLWKRRGFRRKVLLFTVPLLLVIGAWSARNYIVFRSFFFVATSGGVNLLQGNSEKSTVDSDTLTDIRKYEDAAARLSEVDRDRYYRESAVAWIKEHPGAAARLYALKVVEYFSFTERIATHDYAMGFEQPRWWTLIMLFTYEPLLLLILARIAIAQKYPLSELEILFAGLYLVNALFAAMFYSRIRYRLPMDWLLLLLDAGMIQIIFSRLFSRRVVADM
jgi:4-amino-4-deoxy-L-arabinose transferase-like glycosyltransferase